MTLPRSSLTAILAVLISAFGCGHSATGGQLIGQVKYVHHNTPLVCGDYDTAGVSLGVMQNGVGSYSNRDAEVRIPPEAVKQYKEAVESGRVVKINYDEWRVTACTPETWATSFEYISPPSKPAV